MAVELPLFALNTVLFPHMPLALHVFEPRYRQMLEDCADRGTSFGVVAIAEGAEVGGGARPHAVGTLASVLTDDELEDGRHDLMVRGATRFRIEALRTDLPYLCAEAVWLTDEPGAPDDRLQALAQRTSEAFVQYANGLRTLAGAENDEIELPEDAEQLAYLVCATMQVDTAQKQALLEEESTALRLRSCLRLLRREVVFLDQMLARRNTRLGTISPN
jgi:Lon protease-like protein